MRNQLGGFCSFSCSHDGTKRLLKLKECSNRYELVIFSVVYKLSRTRLSAD